LVSSNNLDLDRARAYPYDIPQRSYLLSADGPRELAAGQRLPDLGDRHPVIASGSNQSPQQLARKFDALDSAPIPVLRSRIKNFDSVYSPHFSAYGSIAATLQYCHGVTADVFTTWLNDAQLQRMHETEALGINYDFCSLAGVHVDIDGAGLRETVFAYIGRRGALAHNNQPIALAAVPAQGRQWPAMTQEQVQTLARDRLSPNLDMDRFIGENIEHDTTRHDRTDRLAADAVPFSYAGYRRLDIEKS